LLLECASNSSNNVECKLKALVTFGDGLVDEKEYRRAIVSINRISMHASLGKLLTHKVVSITIYFIKLYNFLM